MPYALNRRLFKFLCKNRIIRDDAGWLLRQNLHNAFVFLLKAVEAEAEAEELVAAVIPTMTGVMTEDMTDMKNMITVTGTC